MIDNISNNDILYTYRPILYLHPDEEVEPMDFDKYINNCELYNNKELIIKKSIISLPLIHTYNNYSNKQLKFIGIYNKPNKNTINNIPIYGKVIRKEEYIDIVYMFFYPHNRGYKICCCYNAGEHQADLEYIITRVNKSNNLIDKIFFSSHSNENQIYDYNNINFTLDRINPIIYVAKNSHANYNKPKTYYRIFGFANDITTDENMIIWAPKKIINLDEREDILSYDGKLGFNSVDSFNRREFLYSDSFTFTKNPTTCFKIFLPFYS